MNTQPLQETIKTLLEGSEDTPANRSFILGVLFARSLVPRNTITTMIPSHLLSRLDAFHPVSKPDDSLKEVLKRLQTIEGDLRDLRVNSPTAQSHNALKYVWDFDFDEKRYSNYLVQHLNRGMLLVAAGDVILDSTGPVQVLPKGSQVEFVEYIAHEDRFKVKSVPDGQLLFISSVCPLAISENTVKGLETLVERYNKKIEKEIHRRTKSIRKRDEFSSPSAYETYLSSFLIPSMLVKTDKGIYGSLCKTSFLPHPSGTPELCCIIKLESASVFTTELGRNLIVVSEIKSKPLEYLKTPSDFDDEIAYWAYIRPKLIPGIKVSVEHRLDIFKLIPGDIGRVLRVDTKVPMKVIVEFLPAAAKKVFSVPASVLRIVETQWNPLWLVPRCEVMFSASSDGCWRTGLVDCVGDETVTVTANEITETVELSSGRLCHVGRYPEGHCNSSPSEGVAKDIDVYIKNSRLQVLSLSEEWEERRVDAIDLDARSIRTKSIEGSFEWVLFGEGRIAPLNTSFYPLHAAELSRNQWTPILLRKNTRIDAQDHRGAWFAGTVVDFSEGTVEIALDGFSKTKHLLHLKWDSRRIAPLGTYGGHTRSSKGLYAILGSGDRFDVIVPGGWLSVLGEDGKWRKGVVMAIEGDFVKVKSDYGVSTEFIYGGTVAPFELFKVSGKLVEDGKFIDDGIVIDEDVKFIDKQRKLITQRNELILPKNELISEQEKLISTHEKLIPSHEKLIPPQNELIPSHEKSIPPQNELIPPKKEFTTPLPKITIADGVLWDGVVPVEPRGGNGFVQVSKLSKLKSSTLVSAWLQTRDIPKEYRKALEMCRISTKLRRDTQLSRVFSHLDSFLQLYSPPDPLLPHFEKLLDQCIAKAYPGEPVREVKCVVWNARIFTFVRNLFQALEWRQKYFYAAMEQLVVELDESRMLILLAELTKSGIECLGRKRHAFHSTLRLLRIPSSIRRESVFERRRKVSDAALGHKFMQSKEKLLSFVDEWTEEFKFKAFSNAFLEPAKMYFYILGRDGEVDNVMLHGVNVYATVLTSVLGVRVPFSPFIDDEYCSQGLVDFLSCTSGIFLKGAYTLQENEWLGKSFKQVPGCPRVRIPIAEVEKANSGKFIFPGRTPREIANNALDPLDSREAREMRLRLAEYMEGFSGFFSVECYGEKLLSRIAQDHSVLMGVVFKGFQAEMVLEGVQVDEDDFRFWLWDSMEGTFRKERAERLLIFMGVFEPFEALDRINE